jgi:hypothetical protein
MIVTVRGQRFTISYGFRFFAGAAAAGLASGADAGADVDALLGSALVAGSFFPSPPQPITRRRVAMATPDNLGKARMGRLYYFCVKIRA